MKVAISNRITSTSRNCRRNLRQAGTGLSPIRLFGPHCASLARTWSVLNPLRASVPTMARISFTDRRYGGIEFSLPDIVELHSFALVPSNERIAVRMPQVNWEGGEGNAPDYGSLHQCRAHGAKRYKRAW